MLLRCVSMAMTTRYIYHLWLRYARASTTVSYAAKSTQTGRLWPGCVYVLILLPSNPSAPPGYTSPSHGLIS